METIKHTTPEQKRTEQQNKALHLFFELVAKEMNDNGITMKQALSRFNLEVPTTKYGIKEYLWRPIQIALYGKVSTTELLKKEEIDKIYDTLNKFFAENLHLTLPPFPSYESLFLKED